MLIKQGKGYQWSLRLCCMAYPLLYSVLHLMLFIMFLLWICTMIFMVLMFDAEGSMPIDPLVRKRPKGCKLYHFFIFIVHLYVSSRQLKFIQCCSAFALTIGTGLHLLYAPKAPFLFLSCRMCTFYSMLIKAHALSSAGSWSKMAWCILLHAF